MMCQHDVSVFNLYHMGIVAYEDIHIKEHICKKNFGSNTWKKKKIWSTSEMAYRIVSVLFSRVSDIASWIEG